jgi:PAS domain S-box-containing protein
MIKKEIPLQTTDHLSITFEMLFRKHDAMMMLIEGDTGKIVDVNDSALRFYGYSLQQIKTMTIGDINQLTHEELEAMWQKAFSEGRICIILKHKLANGESRTVEVHASPVFLGDKKYISSIIQDITVRKNAERLLRDSQERYRDLFNNANIGIFQTALEGAILTANPEFAHMFGFISPEELISKVGNAANLFVDPNRREEIVRIKTENPDRWQHLYRKTKYTARC